MYIILLFLAECFILKQTHKDRKTKKGGEIQTDEGQINRNKDRSLGKQTYRYTDTQKKNIHPVTHKYSRTDIQTD